MRIISGCHRGRRIRVPKNLEVRPTTDRAKESLLNILSNHFELCRVNALDLFSGTGNIGYELASRGVTEVVSVEKNPQCYHFIKKTATQLELPVLALRQDALHFLKQTSQAFDLIFADPPYNLPEYTYTEIHSSVFDKKILKPNGLLVLEHAGKQRFENLEGFLETRNYGKVHFSFFAHGEGS